MRYGVRELDLDSEDEVAFVYDSWLNSYATGRGYRSEQANTTAFKTKWRTYVAHILRQVPVYLIEDPKSGKFLGWFCGDSGFLHYAYVKAMFRKQGIFSAVFKHLGCDENTIATHNTPIFGSVAERWGLKIRETESLLNWEFEMEFTDETA